MYNIFSKGELVEILFPLGKENKFGVITKGPYEDHVTLKMHNGIRMTHLLTVVDLMCGEKFYKAIPISRILKISK